MTSQNLEIRFRVPPEVWDLAAARAAELGYPYSPGFSSGPSAFARRVLYEALKLPEPRDEHAAQSKKQGKFSLLKGDRAGVRVVVLRHADGVQHRFHLQRGWLVENYKDYVDEHDAFLLRALSEDQRFYRFIQVFPEDADFLVGPGQQLDPIAISPLDL